MRKKVLSLLLAAIMVLGFVPFGTMTVTAADTVTMTRVQGGTAVTSGDTVTISTPDELRAFAAYVNAGNTGVGVTFKLTQDIVLADLSDVTVWSEGYAPQNVWTPIGNSTNPFRGTFDGCGFAIRGVYINTTANDQGLFGYIDNFATLQNVNLEDSYIKGGKNVGGVVGCNQNGATVTDCRNAGTVNGQENVGGAVGYNQYGSKVTDCRNVGAVSGQENVGGAVGYNQNGATVTDCFNTGAVNGNSFVGGVVGVTASSAVKNSCNTGAVSGENSVGGIAGKADNSEVWNCFNTGAVSGGDNVGGVAGISTGSIVKNCFNTGAVSGNNDFGSVFGTVATGSTTNCYYLSTSASNGVGSNNNPSATKIDTFGTDGKLITNNNGYAVGSALLAALNDWAWVNQTAPASYKAWKNEVFPTFGGGISSTIWGGTAATSFAAGDGTAANPYRISNGGQLAYLAAQVNSGTSYSGTYFVLTNDIVLNNLSDAAAWSDAVKPTNIWTPIGNSTDPFRGTFDGCGFAVRGVYINTAADNQGLFGYIEQATVQNVGVEDSYIKGQYDIGGVLGYALESSVANCYNAGSVGGDQQVGGVVGSSAYSTVTSCYNTGAINGKTWDAGGVIGDADNGTVTNCYNTGTVGGNQQVGGVIGNIRDNSTVANCYNTGTVGGNRMVGGVVGVSNSATVANCYNTGTVSGNQYIGGVVGGVLINSNTASVTDCYYLSTAASNGSGHSQTGATTKIDAFDANGELLTSNNGYAVGSALLTALNDWVTANQTVPASCKVWENEAFPTFVGGTAAASPIWDGSAATSFAGGDGTAANPYRISNGSQLAYLAAQVNSGTSYSGTYFVLTNDIVLNNLSDAAAWSDAVKPTNGWTPIGNSTDPFRGTFDGCGFAVRGVYINTAADNQGLFGYIDGFMSGATVQNLGVKDSYIKGNYFVGGVAGIIGRSSTVTNCYNTGAVGGIDTVGGVVGYCLDSSVTSCYNTGTVNGSVTVGGVVAQSIVSTVANCYNTGTVGGTSFAGGVAGAIENHSTVTNCYNTGAVSGSNFIGGIVGSNKNASTVVNCYNTGAVSGSSRVGGVAGSNADSVTDCYYLSTAASNGIGDSETGATTKIDAFDANGELLTSNNGYPAGSALYDALVPYSASQNPVSVGWAVMSPGAAKPVLVSISTYEVIWDVEGVKTTERYAYSSTPSYKGSTPEKAATAQFAYTFGGWSPSPDAVTQDVTYVAQFTGAVNKIGVTLTPGTGYTLTGADPVNVPYGGSYSFTLTLGAGYEKGAGFAVKANGNALTSANNTYTIANITAAQTVTVEGVILKAADYTNVDRAIAAANALNKSNYKDFSAVKAAIDAVIRGKDDTEQAIVDGYAVAIENAIKALVYKGADYGKVNAALAKIPADLSLYTDESVKALNNAKAAVVKNKDITAQAVVNGYAAAIENAIKALETKTEYDTAPDTGENGNMLLWAALLPVSGGAALALSTAAKRRGKAN